MSIARENTSSVHQMKTALTSSLSIIKGNRLLINLAFVTIFMGLASEGFDRLWGAHLLEGFALDHCLMKKMIEKQPIYKKQVVF